MTDLQGFVGFVELLDSPWTWGFVLTFFLYFFLVAFPRRLRRTNDRLIRHFGARLTYPGGTLVFWFRDVPWRITRIGVGRVTNPASGGSYPELWSEIRPAARGFVGPESSVRFGPFGCLRAHRETVKVGDLSWIVSSDSAECVARLRELVTAEPFKSRAGELFGREFSHLHWGPELHVSLRRGIERKWVLRYVGLSERIYDEPGLLDPTLDCLGLVIKELNGASDRD